MDNHNSDLLFQPLNIVSMKYLRFKIVILLNLVLLVKLKLFNVEKKIKLVIKLAIFQNMKNRSCVVIDSAKICSLKEI